MERPKPPKLTLSEKLTILETIQIASWMGMLDKLGISEPLNGGGQHDQETDSPNPDI